MNRLYLVCVVHRKVNIPTRRKVFDIERHIAAISDDVTLSRFDWIATNDVTITSFDWSIVIRAIQVEFSFRTSS